MKIPFVGPSYNVEAVSFDCQRSINLYPVLSESGTSKSVSALRRTPGLKLFATAPGGPGRGSLSSTSGRGFLVMGQYFVELNQDGSTTTWGTLNTQSSRVSIAENNSQVMVVDGRDGWIFKKSDNSFTKITDPDFPVTSYITFQDGYFIAVQDGTQNLWISAIGDGLTWSALDFTSVESSPDNLTAVLSDHGNVWCAGNRSIEVYQDTGNNAFPFERIPGAIIQTGCEAPFTMQKFANSIAWLGTDEQGQGVVWIADGYAAKRISTAAIEKRIASIGNFTTAYAYVYHEQGHLFYCIQIQGLDTTLVCDASSNFEWHERMFHNADTSSMELHRAACFLFFNKKNYVADRVDGRIYEQKLDYYDDAGVAMVWKRVSPHISDEKKLISYSRFELDMEVGNGLSTGQGSYPQVCLRYSDDGARTWSSEIWRSMGRIGNFYHRVCWRQLGRGRDRVFEVSGSDPVFVQLNEAMIDAA